MNSCAPGTDARSVFGESAGAAARYVELLASAGVDRGLIGPREAPRLWQRHVFNSVAAEGDIPQHAGVVDVGSGAGLPGIPLVLARPDLVVTLVEPSARRCAFLDEVVTELGLGDRVRVLRGRAEEPIVRRTIGRPDVVVARAVAPLDRLVTWCAPLLARKGRLLALKGSTAEDEVRAHAETMARAGVGTDVVRMVREVRGVTLEDPTWIVSLRRRPAAVQRPAGRRSRS